jgi:hypothetical protein
MMEVNPTFKIFERKIVPYLDGSLAPEETSEFEAFVSTHPDFEEQIKNKKQEIQLLKQMIPVAIFSQEAKESIESEMHISIFNLLKEEPKGLMDSLRIKWEDWRGR